MAAKKSAEKAPPGKKTGTLTDRLRESEKMYRGIFDGGGIPSVVIGEDSLILLANVRFLELCGFSREEIENRKRWIDFVDSKDIEKTEKHIAEILKPGGWAPATYSFRFIDRHGTTREVSASMTLIPESRRIAISLVDSTPRKKVERLLRLNEERYQTLVRTLTTGIFRAMLEKPRRLIWANPAFLSMFGYGSLSDLPRITLAGIIADSGDCEHIAEEIREKRIARVDKIRLRKSDGSSLWASITLELRWNDEGTSAWIDGTVENITDRLEAGEELKRMQSRLGEVLSAVTTNGLFSTDPDGILTMFNSGSERMLGYRAADLVGKETPLIFLREASPDAGSDLPAVAPDSFMAVAARAKTNGCDEREWTFVRNDGTQVPVSLTLTAMHGEGGEITGYLGVANEISDRKRLEEAFRSNTLQMSGVISNIPDPTFAIDRAGKVIAWNRAIENLSGTKAVDILGKGRYEYAVPICGERKPMLADLIFSPDDEIREHGYFNITRQGNAISAETRLLTAGGRDLVVRAIAAPIYNDAGDIAGGIETITDITDLWKREAALQDSESRFRAILDHIGLAVAILEEDLTLSYVNPEFERIVGYVRDEVEWKRTLAEFIAPEDTAYFRGPDGRIGLAGIVGRGEIRFIRWDGQLRNGYLSVQSIPDTGKAVMSLIDITDRILAEDAVQRANEKLNFFSSITRHDILNQLTALKGNLELARDSASGNELLQKSIVKVLEAAEGIQNLVLFTRDYQDIGIQPPEWQDVREIIMRSCTGMKLNNVTVSVLVTGVEIYADLLLERVFFHLVNNAVRHGGDITQVTFAANESFEELVITCEDDGAGIPAESKEEIFARQPTPGSGFGMFVSREILSITGIGIRETGTPGKGARFEIRVPKGAYRFVSRV
jgi:PAS domain S-box-containing protein